MSFPYLSIPEDGYTAVGLMSGTSLDGVDAAILQTDGEAEVVAGARLSLPYQADFREKLRALLGCRPDDLKGERSEEAAGVEAELTRLHCEAVERLLEKAGLGAGEIDVVGFPGQTLYHAPQEGVTLQIGDGAQLARRLGIDVVVDFRSNDVTHGGQGAPLAPLYHAALARNLEKPLCVLNLGGVANVTWLGKGAWQDGEEDILAFDCGPGNALIDDWVRGRTGAPFDRDGALARQGTVDEEKLKALLGHRYFQEKPPKSLDRDAFDFRLLEDLPDADGAATLTAFTARSVAAAIRHFPQAPKRWLVSGGGRHNGFLMGMLDGALKAAAGRPVSVEPVEAAGWDGDALEAQLFAYLAVRSLKKLPLSLPATTGVAAPLSGGIFIGAVLESRP